MYMKKCYIIPSTEIINYELNCVVCAASPTFQVNESGTEATVEGVNGSNVPELGGDDEFDARQRGGDFGSLW